MSDIFSKYADTKKYIIVKIGDYVIEKSPFFTMYAHEISFGADEFYVMDGKYCMTKSALMRVAGAAGLNIVQTLRTDDGSNVDFASHSVTFTVRMPDGTNRTSGASKSFDVNARIEDDFVKATKKASETGNRYSGKTPAQVREIVESMRGVYRIHRAERAETGAIERAIRNILGIRTAYTLEDTKKIFVFPVVSPRMDVLLLDPRIREIAMLNAIGATQGIYGAQRPVRALPTQGNETAFVAPQAPTPPQPTLGEPVIDHIDAPTVVTSEAEAGVHQPSHNPPSPPPPDVQEEEWKKASIADRHRKIEELLKKKKHGYTTEQMKMIIDGTPIQQARKIAQMLALPDLTVSDGWHPNEKQVKRLFGIAYSNGYTTDDVMSAISDLYETTVNDLSREQYDHLCDKYFTNEQTIEAKDGVLPF